MSISRPDSGSRSERSGPLAAAVPARRDRPHLRDRVSCCSRTSWRGSRRSRSSTPRASRSRQLLATLEQKAKKAANLDAYKAQLAEMEQSFGAMLRKLPNKTEVPNLLTDISQQGSGCRSGPEAVPAEPAEQQGLLRRAADQDAPDRQLSRDRRVRQRHRGTAAHRDAARRRDHASRQERRYDQLQLDVTAKTYRYLDEEEQAAAQPPGPAGARRPGT